MRLTTDEIQFIAKKIVRVLVAEGKIEVDSEMRVGDAMAQIITDELAVEDRLNLEVRDVLSQHSGEMERSNITYTEMFKMLKRKMAKEKGIILCSSPARRSCDSPTFSSTTSTATTASSTSPTPKRSGRRWSG